MRKRSTKQTNFCPWCASTKIGRKVASPTNGVILHPFKAFLPLIHRIELHADDARVFGDDASAKQLQQCADFLRRATL